MMMISDTIRVRRYDRMNVVIEVYTENKRMSDGKIVGSWKIEGYYGTVRQALFAVLEKDLLLDMQEIATVAQYIVALHDSLADFVKILNEKELTFKDLDLAWENEELKKKIEKLEAKK